jgi:hypothetical protein
MALWMGILPASFGMVSWKGTIWFDYPHLGVSLIVESPQYFWHYLLHGWANLSRL